MEFDVNVKSQVLCYWRRYFHYFSYNLGPLPLVALNL